MKLQKLLSLTRQAIEKYNMIQEGDKIAIGISGGKDSLALLYSMAKLRAFYPKKFEIIAISVDIGIPGFDAEPVRKLCEKLEVEYFVEKTDIYEIIFNARKEKNPCSLCTKLRKGSLCTKIKELGCNKLAYGHHKDDVIETFYMSLLYEGRLNTFAPVTFLEQTEITLIRPLIYCNESQIIGFINKYELNISKAKCPADGYTKREYSKQLIKQLEKENKGCKNKIFTAITNSSIPGWNSPDNTI